ncbi:hypothetical protein Acy02nite_76960 [Actinoplanes cyaneus]|uniref:Uncharacterized protein n=2 Tax=Actinoplanes cyaneus TaxID=52696 RepID=A0A919M4X2_9ACTN|nr:hypothetical protein [Actinoplanes cyaneus]GID69815.1 hypothetical protein Acy02nite_76960 [Actinoplanes cyaneus]
MPAVRCARRGPEAKLIGMTNETNTATVPARTAGRLITIAAGTAGALLLWAVNDPWAGIDLAVRQGSGVQHIGPVAVAVTALLAGLAAWGLLTILERTTRQPVRIYRIVTVIVLLISLAGPLGSGIGLSTKLVLLGMHVTVGAALIIGLPGRRNCR